MPSADTSDKIAVIGMAGRFPGAPTIDHFWRNLIAGIESIRFFSQEQWTDAAHLRPASNESETEIIKARGVLDDAELFDAEFFGYRPRDVELMDPQQRLFLEQSWAALEHAGYDAGRYDGSIGVYGGVSRNTYFLNNVLGSIDRADSLEDRRTETGNERDYVATRVAYKMDLRGPAVAVHSACSTSLLAIHYACQDLLSFQCDMALAGGASLRFPQVDGYVYSETGILSRDGHCRPFDRDASGTNLGDGVGIVVLKRLDDAIQDGDTIWAVVCGSAANNDGASKLSYMAPSVEGQAEVIACAMGSAGIEADSISYVECHGTGTPLGDPIEVEGLRQAFGGDRGTSCGIGSVKGNLGHLDAAAGVAGFIKTVLSLHHKRIPATLHYRNSNPECRLEGSRFTVIAKTTEWLGVEGPRRAGVSSFGVGGTNVHVILEESPRVGVVSNESAGPLLLPVSAPNEATLSQRWHDLADHFRGTPTLSDLADESFTLAIGRKAFDRRSFSVCTTREQAADAASQRGQQSDSKQPDSARSLALMFSGQGAQRVGMGRDLYAKNAVFRRAFDDCLSVASEELNQDLRKLIFDSNDDSLDETRFAQPALFSLEYALTQIWQSLGFTANALIGHSIGEYVAACLAGVFELEDVIRLVCVRGRLMHSAQRGSMAAVLLSEDQARGYLNGGVSIAAVNAANSCVLSGPTETIDSVTAQLETRGIACRRLRTSHAFHSQSMEEIQEEYRDAVGRVRLRPPATPLISNITGKLLTESQAIDPEYWSNQVRATVRFQAGIETLIETGIDTLIEIGPGRALTSAATRIVAGRQNKVEVLPSLPEPATNEVHQWLEAVGRAWTLGFELDWNQLYPSPRRRVPLPAYPFARSRHWIDPKISKSPCLPATNEASVNLELAATAVTNAAQPAATTLTNTVASSPAIDRYESVLNELVEVLRSQSGLEIDETQIHVRFVDLGFDSLFLSQANGELRKRFKVRIGFRQLLEEFPTPAALARHIESCLPPETAIVANLPAEPPKEIPTTSPVRALKFDPAALPTITVGGPSTATSTGSSSRALTALQSRGIARLTERYCERTRKSKAFTQSARTHLADNRSIVGYSSAWKEMIYQVVTDGSKGSWIRDIDGNEYVDLMNCFGANLLGHGYEPIVQAVSDQLRSGYEVGPQNRLAGEVADRLCAMTGNERVTFAHTGCEAVQYAVRIARAATARKKVMMFAGDVHGRSDLVLARGVDNGQVLRTFPSAAGVPEASVSDTLVMQYGSARAIEVLRQHADEIAAVLIEPVRTRNPDQQPVDFLREIRRFTAEQGICFILDEVVSGFRVHPGGIQAYFDIPADMVTYGKVLGGELPIGAVAGRSEYLDFIDGGKWQFGDHSAPQSGVTRSGGTMIKHPLSLAASVAVLKSLQAAGPDLQRNLNQRTTRFATRVNQSLRELDVPIHLEQFASYFKPIFQGGLEYENLLYCHLRDRGVHAYIDFPCFFSNAHTDTDIAKVAEAFVDSAAEMKEYGFFEPPSGKVFPAGLRLGHNDQGIVTGAMPLLPNQYRFLVERGCPHPNRWGISGVRDCRVRLDSEVLQKALGLLIRQHDALRMQINPAQGNWDVFIAEPSSRLPYSVHRFDVADLVEREQLVQRELDNLHAAISLEQGPMIRLALFDFDDASPQRVFMMVNHLAVDGLSWARLWEDLESAYQQCLQGNSWHPPKTESFRTWALRLDTLAQSPETTTKVDDLLSLPWNQISRLPKDRGDDEQNLNQSVGVIQVSMDAVISQRLDRAKVNSRADLLVAAVAGAVSTWCDRPTVLIDVLGHGREEFLFDDVDLSRSVGFFAWYTPHVLTVNSNVANAQRAHDLFTQIDFIRDLGGMTSDLLRYQCRDEKIQRRMQEIPRSEILVNWQGRFDGVFPDTLLFTPEDPGKASDAPLGRRYYPLTIRGDIIGQQWIITFVYSRNLHDQATIQSLGQTVKQWLEQMAALD